MNKNKVIIIKVAQELFARYGFSKTTVDEIAKAARMGKATLYYYFKGKVDIFKAVIDKESGILDEKIKNAIKKKKTPQDKLRVYIMTRMKNLNKLANIYSALKDEYLDHYAFIENTRKNNLKEEVRVVKNILSEGVNQNIFVIHDLELTSSAIIAALKGLEYPWSVEMPIKEMEKNLDRLLEILFNGITKRQENFIN